MNGLSYRIVNFLGGMLPLYIHEEVNGIQCARSLVDGTLILPIDEQDDSGNGLVTVHWQGDSSRSTVVQGVFIASYAITRYVELHNVAVAKDTKDEMRHLAEHFMVKTGKSLVFDVGDDLEFSQLIDKAVALVGKAGLAGIIKAGITGL